MFWDLFFNNSLRAQTFEALIILLFEDKNLSYDFWLNTKRNSKARAAKHHGKSPEVG